MERLGPHRKMPPAPARFWRLIWLALALLISGCVAGGRGTSVPTTPLVPQRTPRPTFTPLPSATSVPGRTPIPPSPTPAATATNAPPSPSPSPTALPTDTPLPPTTTRPLATPPSRLATATPQPTAPPAAQLPAREGGDWDMETFAEWQNPGPKCGTDSVATGWSAYALPGKQVTETSCFNENKNPVNIWRGQRSQEMTFDYVDATAGVWRTFETVPGHRYRVEVRAKHVTSQSPVEVSLGLELGGGQDPQAATVQWSPWADNREDVWTQTATEFRATGSHTTLFLQAHHPFATAGGATMLDDVRIYDLGP